MTDSHERCSADSASHTFGGFFLSLLAMASRIQVTRSFSPRAWSTPSAIFSVNGSVIRTGYSFFLPISHLFRMYDIDEGQNISYIRNISKGRLPCS